MTRYFFVFFLLSMAIGANSQIKNPTLIQEYPASEKLSVVSTTLWKTGSKGVKSLTISFNDGDTIMYSLSREHKRKATFYLLGSDSTLRETKFGNHVNILHLYLSLQTCV